MIYPQTPAEVRISLKGDWKKEGTDITFSAVGSKMSNIQGIKDHGGNEVFRLLYTIKRIGDRFYLSNDIFTFSAELVDVKENEFTLLEAPDGSNFNRKRQRFTRI